MIIFLLFSLVISFCKKQACFWPLTLAFHGGVPESSVWQSRVMSVIVKLLPVCLQPDSSTGHRCYSGSFLGQKRFLSLLKSTRVSSLWKNVFPQLCMVWDPVNLEIDSLPPHSPDDWNKLNVFFQYNHPHLRHGDLKFSPEKSHLWKSVTFSPGCLLPGHVGKASTTYTVHLFCGCTGLFPPSGCLSPKVMCTLIHHHHHHHHYYFKSQEFQLLYLIFLFALCF